MDGVVLVCGGPMPVTWYLQGIAYTAGVIALVGAVLMGLLDGRCVWRRRG